MDSVNSLEFNSQSPYELLLRAVSLIPILHYVLAVLFIFFVFLYNFLEIHILQDLLTGFRGQRVELTFNATSDVYQEIVSKCKFLHGRYLSTPWLCSPHLQTVFLSFFGRPPVFSYRRQIFRTSDGGTIALDWLMKTDVKNPTIKVQDAPQGDSKDPIMIVIPGLTSDSESAYVKHLAFEAAQNGWNVVVSNHRGLGGVSMTSDRFYNAGWTEDIRKVVDHIHHQYSKALLFLVGTSIGANVLVKYLGEDGANIPIVGAAAVCSPWDLLIGDRFIKRRLVQRFYDKALAVGLKGYAQLHQTTLSRLADWEGIAKSLSVRDFDNCATCHLGKYETVDTYYRRNSSAPYVGRVMVPLLCVSALDDPVCTREAIPWDECRANKNVVLATTRHGGHLAYFEGLSAKNLWWVKAVNEYFSVLLTSPLINQKKELQVSCSLITPSESSIDQGPYINVADDGMVAPFGNKELVPDARGTYNETGLDNDEARDATSSAVVKEQLTVGGTNVAEEARNATSSAEMCEQVMPGKRNLPEEPRIIQPERDLSNIIAPIKKRIGQLSRQSTKSFWLLVYIAVVSTWPVMGSVLLVFVKKKLRNVFSSTLPKR